GRFDRSREEYDALGVLRDPLQGGGNSVRRGGPHQEHPVDAIETSIKSVGKSEISANHLNLRREASRAWIACHRADSRARGRQSRDNLTADGAGPSNNENMIHAGPSYGRRSKGIKVVNKASVPA